MKFFIWINLFLLQNALSVISSKCKEENTYTYEITYLDSYYYNRRYDRFRHHFITNCFGLPRPHRFSKIVKHATITCSNVSQEMYLNFTYHHREYPQDLKIENSIIGKLSANSSLGSFTTIRSLVLKHLNIEDISPGAFDNLTRLETLDLASNNLTTIRNGVFDKLSKLTELDLSQNSLKNLDRSWICGLVSLKKLSLNWNNLTILAQDTFKDLTALEYLDVSNNPLKAISNDGLYQLKILLLKNTQLTSFDINISNSSIKKIDISNSHLEAINFKNLTSLESLDLSNNSLRRIQNWEKLNCNNVQLHHNKITEVEVPHNVKILDLSHNQIVSLKNDYKNGENGMRILKLDFNNISHVESDVFRNFQKLEELDLSHNNLSFIHKDMFVNCSSLKSIDLSHNAIRHIAPFAFMNMSNLITLNISYNNLDILNPDIISEHNLKNLYINNNQFVVFDAKSFVYHFEHLKTLSFNQNPWSCEALSEIFHTLEIGHIKVIDANSLDGDNVEGIACIFGKKS